MRMKRLARIAAAPFRAAAYAARAGYAGAVGNTYPFKTTQPGKRKGVPGTFLGVPSPAGQDWRAGGLNVYVNVAKHLTPDAFGLIRSTDCTADPPSILGSEVAKLSIRVYGLKAGVDPLAEPMDPAKKREWFAENSSEQARWLQGVYDHACSIESWLKASPWSLIYDVLFWQMFWGWADGVGFVPSFEWGERLPKWAGGHCLLHQNHEDIVIEDIDGWDESIESVTIGAPHDWIIMKPGASGNPRGDGWLALRYFRNAQRFQTADANRELFAEQMSIPVMLVRWLSKFLPVGRQSAKFDELEEALSIEDAMQMLMIGENKTIGDLLVYPTDGVNFLDSQETRLKARCMIALMQTALLADTRASGPTGSSKEARVTANAAVLWWASYCAHLCNKYVSPASIRQNERVRPGSVPPLLEGERTPLVQFVSAGELEGDTNPTKDPAADRVPENKRPMPEGNSKNEKGNEDKDGD